MPQALGLTLHHLLPPWTPQAPRAPPRDSRVGMTAILERQALGLQGGVLAGPRHTQGPPGHPRGVSTTTPRRGRADRQGQSGARPGSGRHGKTCQHLWTELLPPASPSAGLINTLPGAGPEDKEKPLRPQKES